MDFIGRFCNNSDYDDEFLQRKPLMCLAASLTVLPKAPRFTLKDLIKL